MNMHHTDWTGGLTTLFHRFGRLASPGTRSSTTDCARAARMGIDGVYSDHVDRMVDAVCKRTSLDLGAAAGDED